MKGFDLGGKLKKDALFLFLFVFSVITTLIGSQPLYAQTDGEVEFSGVEESEQEIQSRDSGVAERTEGVLQINDEEQSIFIGGDEAEAATANGGLSTFFLILRLVLVLALVAAAIYGIVFFLKKIARPVTQQGRFVKVLASAALGPNKAVHVIAIGAKAWLVGDTENGGVSLIAELTDQETVDAMLLEDSKRNAESAGKTGFANLFRALVESKTGATTGKKETTGEAVAPTADRLRKTRERLQEMQ
ncbi:MAG: flagellar biosynthetic protein FliO [Treponema sp.]|nr:flagellar biosynthetic protein FliO [Treponema sp.]